MREIPLTKRLDKKSLIIDSALSLLVRLFGAFATFILYYYVAKVLTIEEAGYFFFALSLTVILSTFSTYGMPIAILRFSGGYYDRGEWINIHSNLRLSLLRMFTFSIALIFISYFLFFILFHFNLLLSSSSNVFLFLVLSIPFIGAINITTSSFQAIHKPVTAVFFKNVLTPFIICVVLAAVDWSNLYNNTLSNVGYVYLIASIVSCLAVFFVWNIVTCEYKKKDRIQTFDDKSSFIQTSNSLILPSLMGIIIQNIGVITVGFFCEPEDSALFSMAHRISLLTTFVLVAVNLIAAPKFAAAFEAGNLGELKKMVVFFNKVIAISALPFVLFAFSFPSYALGLIGKEYIGGGLILQILMVGQLINVGTGSVNYILNMTGNERSVMKISLLCGGGVLFLSPSMAYFFGVNGVAIAISFVIAAQSILAVVAIKKKLRIKIIGLI